MPRVAVVHEHLRSVDLAAPEGCPRYLGRVIGDVDMARPSPLWLREKLRRCGLRSLNAVVDITNYVMLELGQPMHAFDNDKLSGAITVRYAAAGEEITLLNGESRVMQPSTLVIADAERALALAGVMGGLGISRQCCYPARLPGKAHFFSPAHCGQLGPAGSGCIQTHPIVLNGEWILCCNAVPWNAPHN